MVDAARLRSLLTRLLARLSELDPYARIDSESYLADPQSIYASKYLLVVAIEDALAAANHVIASEALRAPTDYADAFRSLEQAGALDEELSHRLQEMARFRNLLIHVYAEVDDRRVHRFLQSDLEDLRSFVRQLLASFPELGEGSGDRSDAG